MNKANIFVFEYTNTGCEKAVQYLKDTGNFHLIEKELSVDGYSIVALANSIKGRQEALAQPAQDRVGYVEGSSLVGVTCGRLAGITLYAYANKLYTPGPLYKHPPPVQGSKGETK